MLLLYRIGTAFYHFALRLAAFRNPKAKLWLQGQTDLWTNLDEKIKPGYRKIWVHCASLGEFEQGRPLIEAIKLQWPQHRIVLTFYSPSGYEVRKNYPSADVVSYFPADSPRNARRWLDKVQPELAIFVKYEFWFYHLQALHARKIPIFLVSARFRPQQVFFAWYGAWFRKVLPWFEHIFVQDAVSMQLLHGIGLQNMSIAGDTRIDRVLQLTQTAATSDVVAAFANKKPLIVVGSSWAPDEDLIATALKSVPTLANAYQWLFAPHEIDAAHIERLEKQLTAIFGAENVLRYAQANDLSAVSKAQALIIDNVGMLSMLYRYGFLSYIGGGFGVGIHNTLEPVAWGLPVAFGPKYTSFSEAVTLIDQKAATCIHKPSDFVQWIRDMEHCTKYQASVAAQHQFLEAQKGATQRILPFVLPLLNAPK